VRIAAQVDEMGRASVAGNVRAHGLAAFDTLKVEGMSFSGRCGVSDSQGLFNGDDMAKKLTLGCYGHRLSPPCLNNFTGHEAPV
jgi:hypothetical protein